MGSALDELERAFLTVDERSRGLLERLGADQFANAIEGGSRLSCAEYIVRAAAKVEQTFGGITTRLWDDPFEWTLPERLGDKRSILQYLDEVAQARSRGMAFIGSDAELARLIPAPVKMMTLGDILTSCLDSARESLDRAEAASQNRLSLRGG